jgi:hypothetical protein
VNLSHPKHGDAAISYTINHTPTKGAKDHTMVVHDTTNKRTATFTLNESTGVWTMKAGKSTVSIKHNPDKSWTVDGTNYKDIHHAGVAMVRHPEVRKALGHHVLAGASEALKGVKPASKSSAAPKVTQAISTGQQILNVASQAVSFLGGLF